MNNSRNSVKRRMDLVARRRSAPARRNHFNHGYTPIGAVCDEEVTYWTKFETFYLYYNSDTPWLQRDRDVTHADDWFERPIDHLNPPDHLFYGHLAGRSSYDTFDHRHVPPRVIVGTVRPRPKDFV